MKLSIEQGLRALQGFVIREWRLIMPVALAFFALPTLALTVIVSPLLRDVPQTMEGMRAFGQAMPGWIMPLMAAASLVIVTGAFALIALAVLPRVSVGEAIAAAVRRLPAWIGATLILFAGLFVILILIGLLVGRTGPGQTVIVLATFLGLSFSAVYLALLMPLMIERRLGPWAAIRTGFGFYRDHLVRLFAGLILFLAGAWVVAMAIQVAAGSVLLLAARLLGAAELGQTLVALLGSLVSAAEWGGFYLLVAFLYRQVSNAR